MANPIAQVRGSIAQVATNLARRPDLARRLRLGLVGYRDTEDGVSPGRNGYLAQVLCDLRQGTNHQSFLARLGEAALASGPSGDYPEDVLAGLALAMDGPSLHWNPYAWKQIVVVGDSSIKVPDHPEPASRRNHEGRTLEAILQQAQGQASPAGGAAVASFVLSAVRVKDPLQEDDHPIGDRQFNRLVAGRHYNGTMLSARGGARPEDFSGTLTASLLEGVNNFERVILQGGGVPAAPGGALSAAEFPYPLVDLLRLLPDEPANPNGGLRFAERFAASLDADGNRVLVPHLFARKGQLSKFVAFLDLLVGLLEDAGQPGARDVASILPPLQAMSLALQIDEPISADLKLEPLLSSMLGLPVKTRIFRLTLGELAGMSAARYREWLASVELAKGTLQTLLDNPHLWFKLHPDAQDRDAHAFIALSDLP
jgi:hypothetical protein